MKPTAARAIRISARDSVTAVPVAHAFLRVDPDLLAAAAEASAAAPAPPSAVTKEQLAPLVAALPAKTKNDFLVRLALGREPGLPAELRHRLLDTPAPAITPGLRSAAELLDAAYEHREAHRQLAERRAAEEAAHREQEAAVKRERRLNTLANQGEAAWKRVDDFIAAKKASEYDLAVALLEDLYVISTRARRDDEFRARLGGLRELHQRKPALMHRLKHSELP